MSAKPSLYSVLYTPFKYLNLNLAAYQMPPAPYTFLYSARERDIRMGLTVISTQQLAFPAFCAIQTTSHLALSSIIYRLSTSICHYTRVLPVPFARAAPDGTLSYILLLY